MRSIRITAFLVKSADMIPLKQRLESYAVPTSDLWSRNGMTPQCIFAIHPAPYGSSIVRADSKAWCVAESRRAATTNRRHGAQLRYLEGSGEVGSRLVSTGLPQRAG